MAPALHTHTHNGWVAGKDYEVEVKPMQDGRIMLYKDTKHFREPSGYKVYADVNEIKEHFELITSEKVVRKTEIKKKH